MTLSERSLKAMRGIHIDLQKVILRAVSTNHSGLEFIITEGLRSEARQKELFAKGLSKTMKSRHLTGHAFDFVPVLSGKVIWKTPAFPPIIALFKAAALELRIHIESGGDWKTFKDYPHIQLSWKDYH